jgi:hypothetical protein
MADQFLGVEADPGLTTGVYAPSDPGPGYQLLSTSSNRSGSSHGAK